MTKRPISTIFRLCTYAVLISSLAACGAEPKPVKRKPVAKAQYGASDYVKHVTLGQLVSPNEDHIDIINIYADQQRKKSQQQALVVLEYKIDKNGKSEQVLAPISSHVKNKEFSELLEILNRLDANGATLHNLHVAVASIAPSKEYKISFQADADTIHAVLERQEDDLIDKTRPLASLDDIRIQLRLIRFFIDHRFRDAAYLAVDNVKKALAALAHDKPEDAEKVKTLSEELETLESDLRKDLPFTL